MEPDQSAPKQSVQGSYCLFVWLNLVWSALEYIQKWNVLHFKDIEYCGDKGYLQ